MIWKLTYPLSLASSRLCHLREVYDLHPLRVQLMKTGRRAVKKSGACHSAQKTLMDCHSEEVIGSLKRAVVFVLGDSKELLVIVDCGRFSSVKTCCGEWQQSKTAFY